MRCSLQAQSGIRRSASPWQSRVLSQRSSFNYWQDLVIANGTHPLMVSPLTCARYSKQFCWISAISLHFPFFWRTAYCSIVLVDMEETNDSQFFALRSTSRWEKCTFEIHNEGDLNSNCSRCLDSESRSNALGASVFPRFREMQEAVRRKQFSKANGSDFGRDLWRELYFHGASSEGISSFFNSVKHVFPSTCLSTSIDFWEMNFNTIFTAFQALDFNSNWLFQKKCFNYFHYIKWSSRFVF